VLFLAKTVFISNTNVYKKTLGKGFHPLPSLPLEGGGKGGGGSVIKAIITKHYASCSRKDR